jgi:Zn-finger nucleic acid-binding protein
MAYRERARGCPVCGDALHLVRTEHDRFERCARCSGIWVEWTTFAAMWSRLSPQASEPVFAPRETGRDRSCPECANRMAGVQLRTVPLDHCGAHGVWFDRVELEASLAASVLPPDQWFRLFALALVRMS